MNLEALASSQRSRTDGSNRLRSEALFMLDRHGIILSANTPAHDVWSTAGKTLCGVPFASLFLHPKSTLPSTRSDTSWDRVLLTALNHSTHCVARPTAGAPFDVTVRIEESHGDFPGYFATVQSPSPAPDPSAVDAQHPGLALVAQHSEVGFFDLNFKAGHVYYSPTWKKILGYSDKEIVNTYDSWLRLIHPADSSAAPDQITRRQTAGPLSFSVEMRMLHRSGHYVWVQCLGTRVFGPTGELERVTGLQLDISERKVAEDEIFTIEERFHRISETGAIAAFDLDFVAKKFWLSPPWQVLAGISSLEGPAAVNELLSVLPPESAVGGAASFFLHFDPGQPSFVAPLTLHPAGTNPVPVLLSAHRQYSRNRDLLRVTGICCPLPKDALPRPTSVLPEPLLTATLAAINEAIIVTDRQSRILFANTHAERLTGWEMNTLFEARLPEIFRLVRRVDGRPADDAVEMALASSEAPPFVSEHALVPARDGQARRIVWCARQVWTNEGTPAGIVLTFRDPEEMSLSPEELLKANRLESLGAVAGGVAHDFNNLLTTILGGISHAKDNRDPSYLGDAERACLAAKALSRQLLATARGQTGERMQNLAPGEILRESARLARAGSGAEISIDIADGVAAVRVYRSQVLQVFQNLIINSIQALPPRNGQIWLRATSTFLAEGSVPPLSAGNYVELSVKDNGSGIAAEHVDKIFEPFFTTKKQGTGLGLPMVLNLVRRHGGQIRVESSVGEGTTFRIFLPPAPQAVDTVASRPSPSLRFGTGRVLLMDDDPDIAHIAGGMLASLDYRYDIARNGEEAIAFYKRYLNIGKPYDAIILDLTVIGGMSGEDTFKAIHELDPDVRAIMCSGYDSEEMAARYLEMGFSGYLSKPFRLGDLAQIVKSVIGS